MKKFYFAAFLLVATLATSFAQSGRTVDLRNRMVTPTNGMAYTAGATFTVDLWVKNLGTSNLVAGDTLYIAEFVGSTVINAFYGVLGSGAPIPNQLNAGDSVEVLYTTYFSGGTSGTASYCAFVLASYNADITESNATNNSACASLNYTTVGIKELSKSRAGFSLMPNPASDNVSLSFNSSKDQSATTEIYDVTGKMVSSANHAIGFGAQNITVSVADLQPGIYSVQLITSEGRSAMKLVVNR